MTDLPGERIANFGGGERAKIGGFVEGVAYLQGGHAFDEAAFEILIYFFMNDEAFGLDAGLAIVDSTGLQCGGDGAFEVGSRKNDEGIAAAEFEDGFLDVFTGS